MTHKHLFQKTTKTTITISHRTRSYNINFIPSFPRYYQGYYPSFECVYPVFCAPIGCWVLIGAGCATPDWWAGMSVVMSCESDASGKKGIRGNLTKTLLLT